MENFFKHERSILIIGLGLIVAGIFHWTIPYSELNMFSQPFILKWSISSSLIGALGVVVLKKSQLSSSLLTTSGFILAVMFRVIYDTTLIDSTSHNLWPFEVVIASIIVLPASLIGAFISSLLMKSFSKRSID